MNTSYQSMEKFTPFCQDQPRPIQREPYIDVRTTRLMASYAPVICSPGIAGLLSFQLNALHCVDTFMVTSLQKVPAPPPPPPEVDNNDHLNKLSSPIPWRFHMKFGFNWPSGFREDIWTHTHTHTHTHTWIEKNKQTAPPTPAPHPIPHKNIVLCLQRPPSHILSPGTTLSCCVLVYKNICTVYLLPKTPWWGESNFLRNTALSHDPHMIHLRITPELYDLH